MAAPLEDALRRFVEDARLVFGDALASIVLFGSAAEDRMRATSDVNLLVLLTRFDPEQALAFRAHLTLLRAAVDLRVMYLLGSELTAAGDAFAVKFADVQRRHRVLHGADPFANWTVSRASAIARLRQVLLNTRIRLREQLTVATDAATANRRVAEAAAPLRAAAAELLALEGVTPVPTPRDALQQVAGESLAAMSRARETMGLSGAEADATVMAMFPVLDQLSARLERLAP